MNRGETMIPKDPVMLLSFVNLKLRDYYSSLDDMCDGLDVSKQEITEKLAQIDYHYDAGMDERTEKRNGIFDWNRRWLV